MPFWFWNDQLDEAELLRQIADFEAHGVHGFVIHPRMGLPRNIGWMSDELMRFMHIAIEEAARREMKVILYDEGMYPSGSSSGQVAAADPTLACRCLAVLDDKSPFSGLRRVQSSRSPAGAPGADTNIVARVPRANGQLLTIVDQKANAYIRGVHYVDEAKNIEDEPVAGDILNPRTAAMVLRLVYQKFHDHFAKHFGKTILGIFTDEPNPLGKSRDDQQRPGTTGILADVSERIGYDFTPHLPALWFDDEPNATKHRADYHWAIRRRLEETWYRPLSEWCDARGVALCGHPDRGDEIGVQKFFQYPGQDLVWRWVLPDHPTSIQGPESTQGKCSSSAMIHYGRRRNSNEFCGAYGHETTFEEFQWLANWCLVRGVNLLIPHAFYYSVRGPRRDERPPQVGGVGCTWWDRFKPFADHCRFLSWLNTDCHHHCNIAILTSPDNCPWRAAKVCLENQYDFNYLDVTLLNSNDVIIDGQALRIREMRYDLLLCEDEQILDGKARSVLQPLAGTGRIVHKTGEIADAALLSHLARHGLCTVRANLPAPGLRARRVEKEGAKWLFLFNEGPDAISTDISVDWPAAVTSVNRVDTATFSLFPAVTPLRAELPPYGTSLFVGLAD
jgi:hypothetical protein